MTKKRISSFALIGLFIVTALILFTGCAKFEPYIASEKITNSSTTSATVEVVVKNDTNDDYYVTITAKVKFTPGFSSSGNSGGTGESQAAGFVETKSIRTFNVTVLNPGTAGSGGVSLESVSLTYSKSEPMEEVFDNTIIVAYLNQVVLNYNIQDIQNYVIGWRGPQISEGRIPFIVYDRTKDYGPEEEQHDFATVDGEEFVLTFYDTNRIYIYIPGVVVNNAVINDSVQSWWSATFRTSGNGSLTAEDINAIKNALPTEPIVFK